MHIAILDEELPYPLTSGKRIRTYNLLQRLASRQRLTYVCHRNADAAEAETAAKHFADLGIATRIVDRTIPRKSGVGFYRRLAGNLLSPLPYSVASHVSSRMRKELATLAKCDPVDLWHCEWTPYAEYLRSQTMTPWLVVAHNVESMIWQRYAENETNPAKRWYIRQQWHKFRRFEQWAYASATCTVAVSAEDASRIRSEFGGKCVEVVDNGVDTRFFRLTGTPRVHNSVLFLGSLDWRPNQDSLRVLLHQVFPEVRLQEPDAKLIIVGRNPPEWLQTQVSQLDGVELHGNVPDVRPHLARAGVLAVPLRIGGGSRLKILEALAAGLAVVSTRIGAEGLELVPNQHLLVTDGSETMAAAIVSAMRNPQSMRQLALAGRNRVVERYDWVNLAEKLHEVWQRCAPRASARSAA